MRLAATGIALVLALTADAAAKEQRPMVLGTVWNGGGTTEIVKLDGLSLKPISRRARVDEPSSFVARSPGRDRAVFTIGRSQDRLRFLDMRRMRFVGGVRIGHVQGSLWREARRLVLLAGSERPSVFLVDPLTRRARLTQTLDGSVTAVARSATRLAVLLNPRERIGPATLAIIDANGNVREVPLPSIRAGGEIVDAATYSSRWQVPGLAIDPAGRHAVVVPAVGSVAHVDLETLDVALHSTKARTLARQRKRMEGWLRSATWFGPHLVAVTGTDYSPVGNSVRRTAAGVTLIDTRDWSARTIEPGATSVAVAGDRLLVSGGTWNEPSGNEGMGLSGYGPDGTKRFHLFGQAYVYVELVGRYAYLPAANNTRYTIVDPRRGTVVARVSMRQTTTLADG
jgi:hypothetical protein